MEDGQPARAPVDGRCPMDAKSVGSAMDDGRWKSWAKCVDGFSARWSIGGERGDSRDKNIDIDYRRHLKEAPLRIHAERLISPLSIAGPRRSHWSRLPTDGSRAATASRRRTKRAMSSWEARRPAYASRAPPAAKRCTFRLQSVTSGQGGRTRSAKQNSKKRISMNVCVTCILREASSSINKKVSMILSRSGVPGVRHRDACERACHVGHRLSRLGEQQLRPRHPVTLLNQHRGGP